MSFSPWARAVIHNSADTNGRSRPAWLRAPTLPKQRRSRAAPDQVPQVPQEQLPFTTPPRRIKRPKSRLLIDTPIPCADTLADPAVRARFGVTDSPIPLPLHPRPSQAPPVVFGPSATPSIPKKNLADVDGTQTRKRRAEDSEIDLVAAVNGIANTTGPIVTIREGQIVPNEESGQQAHKSHRMLGFLPSAGSFTRMISSIYSAVSGLGDKIGRIINPQSYRVAEFRSYLSDKHVTNKRIKIGADQDDAQTENASHNDASPEDTSIRWVDRDGLTTLMDDYKVFVKAISKVWDRLSEGTRQDANKDLEPLRTSLADNASDRAMLNNGEGHDLCELFSLQFKRAFEYLDSVYEIGVIVKIRDNNELVPPVLDYKLSQGAIESMTSIKNFLSAPALPAVCKDILQKYGDRNAMVSQLFLDRIVLDLEAILCNLPAPSYVLSQEYRDRLQATFPSPSRTTLGAHPLLPGSFPEVDEPKEPVKVPTEQLARESVKEPIPVEPSPPESPRPTISRPKFSKTDFIFADLAQKSINRITPEDYRAAFYEESDAHRAIKETYVSEFEPKPPLTSTEVGSIRSILRNRRKHPSKVTPKRLGIRRPPKAVRFTESTISPKQRTHLGLDVPKLIRHDEATRKAITLPEESQEQRPSWARKLLNLPTALTEERPRDRILPTFRHLEEKDGLDPSSRIEELFALPSLKLLELSDDSRAGIEYQKEQAALKAAEEARQAAEAARREAEEKARKELEERLARSGGLRMPIQTFVTPVSTAWHMRAQDTLRASATTTLAKTVEGIDLRRHDFAKVVSSTEWLNDEIVNGSLTWLDQAINSAAGIKDVKRNTRKCLAMSSFFFKRLQEQGVARTQRTLRRYGVEKGNILDVDTILLPICERSHWTLLVVRPSKRTVAHMDSLNARGNTAYTNLAMAWLRDVLEDKFIRDEWKVILHDAPLQNNGHDCGVHTITNAMCVALGLSPVDSYTASDMPAQRIRIACMLLNGGFKGDFDLRVY